MLRERKLPSDTVDEMSNMGDLREELRMFFRMLSIAKKSGNLGGKSNRKVRFGPTGIFWTTSGDGLLLSVGPKFAVPF